MAEIKSTLELVLERTRHLTLTDEEKREHALSESKADINGFLQRYQDGVLNLERLEKEIRALQERSGLAKEEILVREAAKRLSLEGDNEPMLRLLTEMCGVDTLPVATVLRQYSETIEAEAKQSIARVAARLAERGINGSAVVPNLSADKEWSVLRTEIQERFGGKLAQETAALKFSVKP